MSAIIESNIDRVVSGWEMQMKCQRNRPVSKAYCNDIAMIARNVREFPKTNMTKLVGAFPIYYRDTVEDVITKYCNVFTEEAHGFIQQLDMEKKNLVNENGMSLNKNFRVGLVLPENLNAILKNWSTRVLKRPFPSPWWMKKIREVMPMCFIGGEMKIKERE